MGISPPSPERATPDADPIQEAVKIENLAKIYEKGNVVASNCLSNEAQALLSKDSKYWSQVQAALHKMQAADASLPDVELEGAHHSGFSKLADRFEIDVAKNSQSNSYDRFDAYGDTQSDRGPIPCSDLDNTNATRLPAMPPILPIVMPPLRAIFEKPVGSPMHAIAEDRLDH